MFISCHGIKEFPRTGLGCLDQHKGIHLHTHTHTHTHTLVRVRDEEETNLLLDQGDHSQGPILKPGMENGIGTTAERDHIIHSVVRTQSLQI